MAGLADQLRRQSPRLLHDPSGGDGGRSGDTAHAAGESNPDGGQVLVQSRVGQLRIEWTYREILPTSRVTTASAGLPHLRAACLGHSRDSHFSRKIIILHPCGGCDASLVGGPGVVGGFRPPLKLGNARPASLPRRRPTANANVSPRVLVFLMIGLRPGRACLRPSVLRCEGCVGWCVEINDALDQSDDGRNECPAEEQVNDAPPNPT